MKYLSVLFLMLSIFIGSTSIACARVVYVRHAPPAVRVEVKPRAPYRHSVWVAGYWRWKSNRYLWVPGHWVVARPGFVWVSGHWVKKPRGWVWVSGHWKKN